jgi:hypothetical protein
VLHVGPKSLRRSAKESLHCPAHTTPLLSKRSMGGAIFNTVVLRSI